MKKLIIALFVVGALAAGAWLALRARQERSSTTRAQESRDSRSALADAQQAVAANSNNIAAIRVLAEALLPGRLVTTFDGNSRDELAEGAALTTGFVKLDQHLS